MAIKLNKEESLFRNELIFTADAKAVNIDNVLVNLFMLLKHNGIRPKQRARSRGSSFIEIDTIQKVFEKLEDDGMLEGFKNNPEAVEAWIRSNLVNMVFRGNMSKEKVSSLRPIHLESYRVRNAVNTRDYNTADQIYLMLSANPTVKEDLKNFLIKGWDEVISNIDSASQLDVDSLGILHVIKTVKPGFLESSSRLNKIKPILNSQSELLCDDIRRLLVYKERIPRNVIIDYLRTLISFHLSIYIQKLIHWLPEMVSSGTTSLQQDWSIVLDCTDDFESKVSKIAIADAEDVYNRIYDYITATFKINMALEYLGLGRDDPSSLDSALKVIANESPEKELYFKMKFNDFYKNLDDEDKLLVDDLTKYETSYFDKYLEVILNAKAKHQLREHRRVVSNLSQNNSDRGFMAQGRSKRHPRRFVLGTRLLEALVQILVLKASEDNFETRSLSIEELISLLRTRYGLIINGLGEDRFADADLQTNLAFKENLDAFKMKLRQIGFYNDLSDAYILQRIRPRYELNAQ